MFENIIHLPIKHFLALQAIIFFSILILFNKKGKKYFIPKTLIIFLTLSLKIFFFLDVILIALLVYKKDRFISYSLVLGVILNLLLGSLLIKLPILNYIYDYSQGGYNKIEWNLHPDVVRLSDYFYSISGGTIIYTVTMFIFLRLDKEKRNLIYLFLFGILQVFTYMLLRALGQEIFFLNHRTHYLFTVFIMSSVYYIKNLVGKNKEAIMKKILKQ